MSSRGDHAVIVVIVDSVDYGREVSGGSSADSGESWQSIDPAQDSHNFHTNTEQIQLNTPK